MARAPNPSTVARARALARRGWPLVLEAYRRWDKLSDAEKERYKGMAREYGERGRRLLEQAREEARRRAARRR